MSSALDVGFAELEKHLGRSIADREIERVDVDRRGAIVFTLTDTKGTRWFRLTTGECKELLPELDERLPVCGDLNLSRGTETVRVLSWRPGRRIAFGVESGGRTSVVKGYRSGRSELAAKLHERAASAAGGSGAFRVPLLFGWDASTDSMRMELLPGGPPTLDTTNATAFYRVGYALQLFQSQVSTEGLTVHGPSAELAVLDDLRHRVGEITGGLPENWEPTFDESCARSLGVRADTQVAVHRDLHDGQLLFDGRSVGLIDFDLLCAGDPALDAANLTAHLRLRALQGIRGADDAGTESCSRAFLEGLDQSAGLRLSSLRFYQGTTFLRLALIYALRPRWRHLSAPLIELARRCTDELSEV